VANEWQLRVADSGGVDRACSSVYLLCHHAHK
jgi:hypothetical protein